MFYFDWKLTSLYCINYTASETISDIASRLQFARWIEDHSNIVDPKKKNRFQI